MSNGKCGRLRLQVGLRASSCLAAALGPGTALAQVTPPPVAGQIQSNAEQERQAQRRENEQRRSEPATLEAPAPSVTGTKDGACLNVDSIKVEGITLVARDTVDRAVGRFLKDSTHCLTLKDIDQVRLTIWNVYETKGLGVSQIYIPPDQDTSAGTLILRVIEGRIENYRIFRHGKEHSGPDNIFLGKPGSEINLRRLEQALDTISALRTYRINRGITAQAPAAEVSEAAPAEKQPQRSTEPSAIELKPSDTRVGYSVVTVNTSQRRPFFADLGIDNFGSDSTGRTRINAALGVEDLLGAYDSLVVNGSHTTNFGTGANRARNGAVQFSVPYGYWSLQLWGDYFDYRSAVRTNNQTFITTGDQSDFGATIDRVLLRGKSNVVSLGGGFAVKSVHNYINGLRLDNSTRRLTTLNLQLSARGRLAGASMYAELDFTRGIRAFGALEDGLLTYRLPHAQYSRLTGSLSLARSFPITSRVAFDLRSFTTGSWSPHALYGTEKVQIGGPFTVRGFMDESLAGDVGGFTRNEASLRWDITPRWRQSLFVGLDAGWIARDYGDPTLEHALAGISGGTRIDLPFMTAEARVEAPLARPSYFSRRGTIFRFRLNLSL